jgi:glycosyltransferase involved in cell wall biosynthesis
MPGGVGAASAARTAKRAGASLNPGLDLGLNLDLNLNVLFFGRVEAYKGVDTLLAAWMEASEDLRVKRCVSSSPDRWRGM